jgi:hypothetical protein
MGLGRSGTEEHFFCPRTGVAQNYDLTGYPIGTMNDYPPAKGPINEGHPGVCRLGAYGIGENIGAAMSGITFRLFMTRPASGSWTTPPARIGSSRPRDGFSRQETESKPKPCQ